MCVSLDVEDLEDVGLIGGLLLATVDGDDFVAGLAESHILGGLNNQLDEVIDTLE
jgi:hypothetical protein